MHFMHGTQDAVAGRLLQLKIKLQEQCSATTKEVRLEFTTAMERSVMAYRNDNSY